MLSHSNGMEVHLRDPGDHCKLVCTAHGKDGNTFTLENRGAIFVGPSEKMSGGALTTRCLVDDVLLLKTFTTQPALTIFIIIIFDPNILGNMRR